MGGTLVTLKPYHMNYKLNPTKEELKAEKEKLVSARLEAIELSDYDLANEILKKIQELNRKIYYE